jgi:peptide-methionine (S)-S-oxide reductase
MDRNKHAYFAGGCFWCTEAVYKRIKGVLKVVPGYCGGNLKNPTYNEVCSGLTGHAETVQVIYDSEKVSFKSLLEVFFKTHNPTTINRQGNDVGSHYRSIAFYSDGREKKIIENYIDKLNKHDIYSDDIVTQIIKFDAFYKAEKYHENYYELNKNQPYCDLVITPKIRKFEQIFESKISEN